MNEQHRSVEGTGAPQASPGAGAARAGAHGEVLVTLLMCDLVDSTGLSTSLAPSQLRDVLMSYYSVCLDVTRARAGRVIRYIGDGVVCLFAHGAETGQGARNALDAAVSIHRVIRSIPVARGLDDLTARTALATGWGIRGAFPQGSGACQELLFGQIPFLADRMKGLAAPDEIVVCDATASLLRTTCALGCVGQRPLRGFPAMKAVWRVMGATAASMH